MMPRRLIASGLLFIFCLASAGLLAASAGDAEIVMRVESGEHPGLSRRHFSDVKEVLLGAYRAAQSQPLWIRDGRPTPQALEMIGVLVAAGGAGLFPEDYDAERLRGWAGEGSEGFRSRAREVEFEVGMSIDVVRYALALHAGRVRPRQVGFDIDVSARRSEISSDFLIKLSRSEHPAELLSALEPRFPLYRALKLALERYRRLSESLPASRFNFPVKLTPGMSHPDVPRLREFLHALGDLRDGVVLEGDPLVYGASLEEGVRTFQERHGLTPDGVIGRATSLRLMTPLRDRLRQIEYGLERLRWLPDENRGAYILVNIPSFKLYAARSGEGVGRHDLEMNVVVGEAIDGRKTPVFHADLTQLTFRPYWNVPSAIASRELVPAIRRNPAYLARNRFEIVASFSQDSPVLPPSPGVLDQVAQGSLKLRQMPGAENALGLFRFSFPNTSQVYLHGSPAKSLFSRDRRDFSHGCVRLKDPALLAQWVLEENGDWPKARIDEYAGGEVTKTIALKKPIPVYILYLTVMADAEGRVSFYEDVYGHDQELGQFLSKAGPRSP